VPAGWGINGPVAFFFYQPPILLFFSAIIEITVDKELMTYFFSDEFSSFSLSDCK